MKKDNIFPDISPLETDAQLRHHCSNWVNLNDWFKEENPGVDDLKRAAILEGKDRKRLLIINRLVARIMKIDKQKIIKALLACLIPLLFTGCGLTKSFRVGVEHGEWSAYGEWQFDTGKRVARSAK